MNVLKNNYKTKEFLYCTKLNKINIPPAVYKKKCANFLTIVSIIACCSNVFPSKICNISSIFLVNPPLSSAESSAIWFDR